MSLSTPLWLLALPPIVLAVIAIQAAGLSGVGARQRRVALGIRIGVVTMLVLALAGLRVGGGTDRVAVVFLVDRSDSVGPGSTDRAIDFVADAVEAKRRGDLVAVVAFGREPRLEFTMTEQPDLAQLGARPDATATDLARALRLAAALFPEGVKRRIVVLSDGRETGGNARREAARLAREGIVIEGLTLADPPVADTLVESLDAPQRVRRGEAFDLAVTLRGPAGPAHLELLRDGRVTHARALALRGGRTTIALEDTAGAPGLYRYEARVRAAADPVPQNDRATAAVIVDGPPRVLLVEGEKRDGATLAAALRAGGLRVDRTGPEALPGLDGLLAYDGVVLADVPAHALASDAVATLRAAVSDAGIGLVTIGGEESYGPGGYRGSDLESLLPVDSDIKDPMRRPSVAEALVIDTSGSMAACHCRGDGPAAMEEGGINKTDISRAGAARAIRALSRDDIVGVLAFNTESRWVIPLQQLPPEEVIEQGLSAMTPAGGTSIPQALRTAVAELKQTKAKLKHIIMFTDGWTDQESLIPVAEEIARQGITLSIVATGEGTGDVLARMAEAGGGRFYAGTNLTDVPAVMMQEAILASRNFVNEGLFTPVIAAQTALTEALERAPALLGYVATTAKGAATVELSVGQDDPLLATWRVGLGTVSSWTSDAKARWARPWVGWEGFRDFWTRAVRATFAAGTTGGFAADARVHDGVLRIDVAGERALGPGAVAVARVIDPTLRATELSLERTGAGSFTGEMPVTADGTYLVLVTVRDGGALAFRDRVTATVAYSAEYIQAGADETMLADLARATGGRASIVPADAFDAEGLRASAARRAVWPLLIVLAALLLPVDIAARRLLLGREDLARARAWVAARLRKRRGPQEREERIEGLLAAKRRTRARYGRSEDDPETSRPEPPET